MFSPPVFRGINHKYIFSEMGSELYQILWKYSPIIGALQVYYTFQIHCSLSERGRLKRDRNHKSKPNLWLSPPL